MSHLCTLYCLKNNLKKPFDNSTLRRKREHFPFQYPGWSERRRRRTAMKEILRAQPLAPIWRDGWKEGGGEGNLKKVHNLEKSLTQRMSCQQDMCMWVVASSSSSSDISNYPNQPEKSKSISFFGKKKCFLPHIPVGSEEGGMFSHASWVGKRVF